MSSEEFKIKVGNNDNVPLVFENKEHEQYFEKLLEMKVVSQIAAQRGRLALCCALTLRCPIAMRARPPLDPSAGAVSFWRCLRAQPCLRSIPPLRAC